MNTRWAEVCLGLIMLCLTQCDQDKPKPLDDEARRVTNTQAWASQREALRLKQTGIEAEVKEELPPGSPAPELFELTQEIYNLFDKNSAFKEWQAYDEIIPAAGSSLKMIPIKGGSFLMGSPASEPLRKPDEGPVHEVSVGDFWMSEIEIPWQLYTAFMENGRPRSKAGELLEKRTDDELWDAVTQPTAPYASMNLGMGNGYEKDMPAIAMSHHAANKFCEWLSAQTGRYYRLPTEAEWEYACRSGGQEAYPFGNEESKLDDYAWYWNNSNDRYQRVKSKKPNAWGLYNMNGNVAEWVLDSYQPNAYFTREGKINNNPVNIVAGAPHVVRGGSWDDDPDRLRSAARRASSPSWNQTDPQNPKSIWYLTNGGMVGFRVVRPKSIPPLTTIHRWWNFSKGEP